MIEIQWGHYEYPITVQWGNTPTNEQVSQLQGTPNPIAVIIATSGTAAPVNWSQRQW